MKQTDQSEITAIIKELKQKPLLNRKERRYLTKLEGKLYSSPKNSVNWKGLVTKILLIIIGLLAISGIGWYMVTRPNLPPIDMAGHIEENPPAHILNTEMPESIQKHMFEHADGKGKPGVLIQYNCRKYRCEKDFIDKLKTLVKKFPENVYLAPGNYDGKIILTRLGQRQVLTSYSEQQITDFIANK